jgi:large subunit ribosomal protein L9
MEVILCEDHPKLGKAGDVVKVSDGYGRNYLIPKGLAVIADTRNIKRFEHQKKLIRQRIQKQRMDAEALAKRISQLSVTIKVKAGEQGKLYGSVTSKDIEQALSKEDISIDRRNILLSDPIKSLGIYEVEVKIHSEVNAKLKVWVVSEQ